MGLDSVEFVLDIEKKFSIDIDDSDAETLFTVDDVVQYIVKEAAAQNGATVAYNDALNEITDMLVNTYGVTSADVTPTARIVKDLGLD